MTVPAGGPYFDGPGQWDAYKRWNFSVPCQYCGRRKMDNPANYGLQPDPDWPKYWVFEDCCGNCIGEIKRIAHHGAGKP